MTQKKHILIIDDDEILPDILKKNLLEEGTAFQVVHKSNGEEGLHHALENHPDLIILDMMMPGMNGIDVLKALRDDVWGTDARVMLLSNSESTEYVSDALLYGVEQYLVKSDWDIDDVIAKILEQLHV